MSEWEERFDKKFVCVGGTKNCPASHEPMLENCGVKELKAFISTLLTKRDEDKQLELAEAQLLGFATGKDGYSIEGLVEAMGLTKKEWVELRKQFDMKYLTKQDRVDIADLLSENRGSGDN